METSCNQPKIQFDILTAANQPVTTPAIAWQHSIIAHQNNAKKCLFLEQLNDLKVQTWLKIKTTLWFIRKVTKIAAELNRNHVLSQNRVPSKRNKSRLWTRA